jgi:hypothetical protein
VQREHVEGDGVTRLQRPAQDGVRGAVGLDVGHLLERAVVEDSARSSKKLRGMYQVREACEPATNSRVLSRGTGSSGIQNETVSKPSTL